MKKITLNEAIAYFDSQVPNQYSREDKTNWINELDELLFNSIIKDRENPEIDEFTEYSSTSDGERELLVPFMFKEIYRYYLEKNVAYSNREITSFNNAAKLFESNYDAYFSWYNRNHKTKEAPSFSI
ncbi:MAG: hypothetical protein IJ927_04975 [Eubacterium sp.]|jgi:hypothetical protein|nr:hypothetical protein [Eubacterium sp.]